MSVTMWGRVVRDVQQKQKQLENVCGAIRGVCALRSGLCLYQREMLYGTHAWNTRRVAADICAREAVRPKIKHTALSAIHFFSLFHLLSSHR